jgi:hypothetical protein
LAPRKLHVIWDVSHDALRSQRVVAMWSPGVEALGDHDQIKVLNLKFVKPFQAYFHEQLI